MPLKEGSSREVVSENIRTEMEHNKPQKQAVAIAMKQAGLSNKDAAYDRDPREEIIGGPPSIDINADRIMRDHMAGGLTEAEARQLAYGEFGLPESNPANNPAGALAGDGPLETVRSAYHTGYNMADTTEGTDAFDASASDWSPKPDEPAVMPHDIDFNLLPKNPTSHYQGMSPGTFSRGQMGVESKEKTEDDIAPSPLFHYGDAEAQGEITQLVPGETEFRKSEGPTETETRVSEFTPDIYKTETETETDPALAEAEIPHEAGPVLRQMLHSHHILRDTEAVPSSISSLQPATATTDVEHLGHRQMEKLLEGKMEEMKGQFFKEKYPMYRRFRELNPEKRQHAMKEFEGWIKQNANDAAKGYGLGDVTGTDVAFDAASSDWSPTNSEMPLDEALEQASQAIRKFSEPSDQIISRYATKAGVSREAFQESLFSEARESPDLLGDAGLPPEKEKAMKKLSHAFEYLRPRMKGEYNESANSEAKAGNVLANAMGRVLVRKTGADVGESPAKTEWDVQGNYGQGWEDVTTEESKEEASARLREYNENEPNYPHRLRRRSVGADVFEAEGIGAPSAPKHVDLPTGDASETGEHEMTTAGSVTNDMAFDSSAADWSPTNDAGSEFHIPTEREMEHEKLRIATMHEPALRNRIDKITHRNKMLAFIMALEANHLDDLAQEARQKLQGMDMADDAAQPEDNQERVNKRDINKAAILQEHVKPDDKQAEASEPDDTDKEGEAKRQKWMEQAKKNREEAEGKDIHAKDARELGVPEKHQLKIARQTVNMPDAMIGVMGGMTREQAEKIVNGYKDGTWPAPHVAPKIRYDAAEKDDQLTNEEMHKGLQSAHESTEDPALLKGIHTAHETVAGEGKADDAGQKKVIAWLNNTSVAVGSPEEAERKAREIFNSEAWQDRHSGDTVLRITTYGAQRPISSETLHPLNHETVAGEGKDDYRYRPLLRPAHGGGLPRDLEWDYAEAPRLDPTIAVRRGIPLSKHDHGVIVTKRPLTAEEREQWGIGFANDVQGRATPPTAHETLPGHNDWQRVGKGADCAHPIHQPARVGDAALNDPLAGFVADWPD